VQRVLFKRTVEDENVIPVHETSWFSKRGSPVIFAYKFARLLVIAASLALTVATSAQLGWSRHNVAVVATLVR
jgi:hypothetical protein